jgi:hypothetical protein
VRHGVPTTEELVAAVREFLDKEVRPATTGRLSFHARVAANVLAMVERELRDGDAIAGEHAARLAALGVRDDAELVRRIRDGSLDARMREVVAAVRAHAVGRLRIANPRHLDDQDGG